MLVYIMALHKNRLSATFSPEKNQTPQRAIQGMGNL
jgi:hypothetical protein